jgi:hypothetical protein
MCSFLLTFLPELHQYVVDIVDMYEVYHLRYSCDTIAKVTLRKSRACI